MYKSGWKVRSQIILTFRVQEVTQRNLSDMEKVLLQYLQKHWLVVLRFGDL